MSEEETEEHDTDGLIDEADEALDAVSSDAIALQRWLQWAGVGSRNAVRDVIAAGRVSIDEGITTRFAAPVYAASRVRLDGAELSGGAEPITLLLYKPVKHLTQLNDTDSLPGLARYLPVGIPRVFAVGRLDVNTEGALLFTNDGALARRVLDPEVGLEKTYRVKIRDHLREDDPGFERIRRGMKLGHEQFRPAKATLLEYRTRATWIELVLTEGRFREIRRMCAANNWQIVKLRRVLIGPIGLGELTPRCCRELAASEVQQLRAAVGLD